MDVRIIERNADRLNSEVKDVLEYQRLPACSPGFAGWPPNSRSPTRL